MKKDNSIVFWVLGLGGLGYAIFRYFNKGKKVSTDRYEKVPDTNLKTGEKYSDYQIRVFYLQTLLGVGTDYIVGKNTTAALKELYLGKLSYGDISPENIEKYINEVEGKNTPYNKKMKAEAELQYRQNSEQKTLQIIDAYNSNKNQVLFLDPLNSVNGYYTCYVVVFNSAIRDWQQSGTINLQAGKRTRDGGLPYSYSPKWNALIMRVNDNGKYVFVAIDPRNVAVTLP